MITLAILLGFVWFLLPLALLLLFLGQRSSVKELQKRILQLEHRLFSLEKGSSAEVPKQIAQPVTQPVKQPVEAEAKTDPHDQAGTPRAFVFNAILFENLVKWLAANWILVAGGMSLILAGIFLVQYSAERGLLSPMMRIWMALGFGGLMVIAGEALRQRIGDEGQHAGRHLPSVLTGAGIVTLFAATLAAYGVFDLIPAQLAFGGLAVISVMAIGLGWLHGPVLAAMGIIGATAAPFLIGGESQAPWPLYYYFAVIALVGLSIDAVKRWAWVSMLALIAPGAAIWLLFIGAGFAQHLLLVSMLFAGAAMIIPEWRLVPRHSGPSCLDMVLSPGSYPLFPTRLSALGVANAAVAATWIALTGPAEEGLLGLSASTLLIVASLTWMKGARALWDHALMPIVGLVTIALVQGVFGGALLDAFQGSETPVIDLAKHSAWIFVGIAVLATWLLAAALSSQARNQALGFKPALVQTLVAAALVPSFIFILAFYWHPEQVYGPVWSWFILGAGLLQCLSAFYAARFISAGGEKLAASLIAIGGLTVMGLATFVLLSQAFITLALGIMVVLVARADRQFDLPILGNFAAPGIGIVTYQILMGVLGWSQFALFDSTQMAVWELVALHLGTLALFTAAYLPARGFRSTLASLLESSAWIVFAVFVYLIALRYLPGSIWQDHWSAGMLASLFAAILTVQLHQLPLAEGMALYIKRASALLFAACLMGLMLLLVFETNPLMRSDKLIYGLPFLSTLAVAYLPLAGILAVASKVLRHLPQNLALGAGGVSAALIALYIAQSIRHFWQGPSIAGGGVTDLELYSYTLAMLIASVLALSYGFLVRLSWLYRLALVGIGLTIAKVFLIDVSGLSGLIRVLSFMGLGLSLVGLTWLNRLMQQAWQQPVEQQAAKSDANDPS